MLKELVVEIYSAGRTKPEHIVYLVRKKQPPPERGRFGRFLRRFRKKADSL